MAHGSGWITFGWRVTALHMVSYTIAGLLALYLMNYRELFSTESLSLLMRPTESVMVAAGPALQIVNGFFLSLVLFPFRSVFLAPGGWKNLWLLIVGFTLFAPQLPGPGSFEGLLYTKLPWQAHVAGWPELLTYSLLFSLGLYLWYRRPAKYLNLLLGLGVGVVVVMSTLGVLSALGRI